MLARLECVPGIRRAEVDVTGRQFRVALEPGAKPPIGELLAILGSGSRLVEEEPDTDGELWIHDARTLSLIEARILARRKGSAAASAAGLDTETASRLIRALRKELAAEFQRVHHAGGTEDRAWYEPAFRGAIRRALTQVPGLPDEQREVARRALESG